MNLLAFIVLVCAVLQALGLIHSSCLWHKLGNLKNLVVLEDGSVAKKSTLERAKKASTLRRNQGQIKQGQSTNNGYSSVSDDGAKRKSEISA